MVSLCLCQQDTLILGSVGSNTWRGSLHEHREKEKERQIKDPEMEKDSYMGTEQIFCHHMDLFYKAILEQCCFL